VSRAFPKISVVTPSFNQARYLERTIKSVLDQDYPQLEYIIVDGGSTDGSQDIIRTYADSLAWWVSEPDSGQANAINKGLRRATGDWVAWQNSDDVYYPGAFESLARACEHRADADLIVGNVNLIDSEDRVIRDLCFVRPTLNAVLAEGMVLTNQAAFWRREVHERVGWLNESLECAFDYDWFLRLLESGRAEHVNRFWGGYRLHADTKTSVINDRCREERVEVLAGRDLPRWKVFFYRVRRLILLLAQGRAVYVLRGLFERITLRKRI
jgi:glycosyltransferase involved in cell wall biosynthesis